MKPLKLSVFAFALLLASACSKPETAVAVTGVKLSPQAVELEIGKTAKLTAEVLPADAADKSVVWTSSNQTAVYVGKEGDVLAIAAGEADITVTTNDGGFKAVCKVTVKDDGSTPDPTPDPDPDPEPTPDPGPDPDPEPTPDPNPDPEPNPEIGGGSHDGFTIENYIWN